MKKYLSIIILTLSLSPGLFSCATNPVSNKKQFVLMSEEQELAIGRKMDPQIIKQYGLYNDPELQDYVDSIGQKVARKSDRPELFYHFKLLNSPMINAFALPGGYIYITRGILALLNSEAELAGVLGHEVGHVTARHAVQQYTQAQTYQALATVASIFVPEFRNQSLQQLADVAAIGILRGYGRKMEMESDRLGIKYSYRARYNPMAIPNFLISLKNASKAKGEKAVFHGLFSTHPDTTKRISAARTRVNNLFAERRPENLNSFANKYLDKIEGIIYGTDPEEGIVNGNIFQHPSMRFEVTYPKRWKIFNTKKAVISKDKEKDGKYFSQLMLEILGKRTTPSAFAGKFFKKNNVKPTSAKRTKINGLDALIATFETTYKRDYVKVMAGFILVEDKMFILIGQSKIEDYRAGEKYFSRILHSFRSLSKEEAASIKPERIKIYTVAKGDTIKTVAKKFKKDPKKIALINGFESEETPLSPSGKIKVITNF